MKMQDGKKEKICRHIRIWNKAGYTEQQGRYGSIAERYDGFGPWRCNMEKVDKKFIGISGYETDMDNNWWLSHGYKQIWMAMTGYDMDMDGYEWISSRYWRLWDRDGLLLDRYQWMWMAINSYDVDTTGYEGLYDEYWRLWDRDG